MKAPSLLILGSTGQLGSELVALCARNAAWKTTAFSHKELEVTDPHAVEAAIEKHQPTVLFNCTAYNLVDGAEGDPYSAFAINAAAVTTMARLCGKREIHFVHFSTDYVFDGRKQQPYSEDDPPNPLNVYGLSKFAGEQAVRVLHPQHCIIRTCGVFGLRPGSTGNYNFVEKILSRAADRSSIEVLATSVVSPTSASDLALATLHLIERNAVGTFHVANGGQCTWYEFAREIVRRTCPQVQVVPLEAASNAAAARPAYSALSSKKLLAQGIRPLPSWQDALATYLEQRPKG